MAFENADVIRNSVDGENAAKAIVWTDAFFGKTERFENALVWTGLSVQTRKEVNVELRSWVSKKNMYGILYIAQNLHIQAAPCERPVEYWGQV